MYIETNTCIGCGRCISYCAMKALSMSDDGVVHVERNECVECGACVRSGVCPVGALKFEEEIPYPRVVRRLFSDPNFSHSTTTQGMGRGTAEMKSNDVTGRFKRGEAGIGIELGRPHTGVWFEDIEKVTMHLMSLGIEFEEKNPLTVLMEDKKKGSFKQELMGEKLLSTIVEFKVPTSELLRAMKFVKELETKVNTVFSVFIVTRVEDDGSLPNLDILREQGYAVSPNAKINIGLGKPRFRD